MKKITLILISCSIMTLTYLFFLVFLPLKTNVFYTNDERTEEYIYSKKEFQIVLVGSSLSGAFEGRHLFNQPYFNLYLPYTGCCTGIEIIRLAHKYPKYLFIEVNHFDRGIDSSLIGEIFNSPLSGFKGKVAFLQKKNKFFLNLIDRIKKPVALKTNNQAPPQALYKYLLAATQKEWQSLPKANKMQIQFSHMTSTLDYLAGKGTEIVFYEVPMDSSLNSSNLLVYQRRLFEKYALKKGYPYIHTNQAGIFKTGDGVHMLEKDAERFYLFFKTQIGNIAGKNHTPLE